MKDANRVEIPKDLALAILEWHTGQGSSVYAAGSSGYAGRAVDAELVSEAIDELETDEAPGELVDAMREILTAWEEQREPDSDILALAVLEGDDDEDEEDEDGFGDDEDDFDDDDLDNPPGYTPPGDGEPIDPADIRRDEEAMARDRRNKLRR